MMHWVREFERVYDGLNLSWLPGPRIIVRAFGYQVCFIWRRGHRPSFIRSHVLCAWGDSSFAKQVHAPIEWRSHNASPGIFAAMKNDEYDLIRSWGVAILLAVLLVGGELLTLPTRPMRQVVFGLLHILAMQRFLNINNPEVDWTILVVAAVTLVGAMVGVTRRSYRKLLFWACVAAIILCPLIVVAMLVVVPWSQLHT